MHDDAALTGAIAELVSAARVHSTADMPAAVRRLSRLFTDKRKDRSGDYFRDPALRAAYLNVFLPKNAARIALLLRALLSEGHTFKSAPRVLDVGAGPCSGILGALAAFGGLSAATAWDRDRTILKAGKDIAQQVITACDFDTAEIRYDVVDMRSPLPKTKPFDLIIVANAIGELGTSPRTLVQRERLCRGLFAHLSPRGHLLIVEPGTRVHSRALMQLRDRLVTTGAPVAAPCRGASSCPLLARGRDWCHSAFDWERPEALRRLERAAGLTPGPLLLSYLLLGMPSAQQGARVVGEHNGARLLCGERGLFERRGRMRRRGSLDVVTH